jgi:hypothetical protein
LQNASNAQASFFVYLNTVAEVLERDGHRVGVGNGVLDHIPLAHFRVFHGVKLLFREVRGHKLRHSF